MVDLLEEEEEVELLIQEDLHLVQVVEQQIQTLLLPDLEMLVVLILVEVHLLMVLLAVEVPVEVVLVEHYQMVVGMVERVFNFQQHLETQYQLLDIQDHLDLIGLLVVEEEEFIPLALVVVLLVMVVVLVVLMLVLVMLHQVLSGQLMDHIHLHT
jgi:hypothetical protein